MVSYCYRSPICPTYDLLYVLHCSLYIPLDIVFCVSLTIIYSISCSESYVYVGGFK
jgi:hypothetical protein